MTKLQQNKPRKITTFLKILLISTGVLLLLAPIAYITYQKYLENQEAKNFAALKVDFLELQKEFNKIDPGWEYSERCDRAGSGFGIGYISCSIGLIKNSENKDIPKYIPLYHNKLKTIFNITEENISFQENQQYMVGFSDIRITNKGSCVMIIDINQSVVSCVSDTYKMYFPKK